MNRRKFLGMLGIAPVVAAAATGAYALGVVEREKTRTAMEAYLEWQFEQNPAYHQRNMAGGLYRQHVIQGRRMGKTRWAMAQHPADFKHVNYAKYVTVNPKPRDVFSWGDDLHFGG